jgi:predicted oxidoreductase
MQTMKLGRSTLDVSRIAFGCMHIGGAWDHTPSTDDDAANAARAVDAALESGVTLFDHADIYCLGKSEIVFGRLLRDRSSLRSSIFLQSKCGIRFAEGERTFTMYDFRREYILSSVNGILKRLNTGYLDLFILHRPDPLVEPDEVARAFDELHSAGKVRYFGVSNHSGAQIDLLQKSLTVPLIVNQLELNIVHCGLIDQGVWVNQRNIVGDATGTLEYCRLHGIAVQAWAPLANGYLCGRAVPADHPAAALLTKAASAVTAMAKRKGVSPEAVCLAWLLRHPATIQPVLGTTDPSRIKGACEGDSLTLSHEEWYELFVAGRGDKLP